MIDAYVVASSVAPHGGRIDTIAVTYPRFVHSELMTHRVFSRNASSSRAIPTRKMIQRVIDNPAEPVKFGRNQPGMQDDGPLGGWRGDLARKLWRLSRWPVVWTAIGMDRLGVHKQVVNRLIEPWSHITVLITSTEWENFFALRCHPDADPTMQAVATAIRAAHRAFTPKPIMYNQWHLPFIRDDELSQYPIEDLLKFSAARCARVSYLRHDGVAPSPEDDLRLYNRLVGSTPIHASPTEHQAYPTKMNARKNLGGNLGRGWVQYRKLIEE